MEQEKAKNVIEKVTLRGDRCEVSFKEKYTKANYSNDVNKKCDQIVDKDLREAFKMLRPFLVTITEQPEASLFNAGNIGESLPEDIEKEIAKYHVTGYTHAGTDDNAGVTITGQKMLKTGQVLNLCAPFTKFVDNNPDAYAYGDELDIAIQRCDYEVSEYLFNQKWGLIQQQLDFEVDTPNEALEDNTKKKKTTRKGGGRRTAIKEPVVFDQTA